MGMGTGIRIPTQQNWGFEFLKHHCRSRNCNQEWGSSPHGKIIFTAVRLPTNPYNGTIHTTIILCETILNYVLIQSVGSQGWETTIPQDLG